MWRIVAVLILCCGTISASDKGTLKGAVINTADGGEVPYAYVLIHRSGPPPETANIELKTQRDGSFSVELDSGFYDVFVYRGGFSPTCKQIKIESGRATVYKAKIGMSEIERTD